MCAVPGRRLESLTYTLPARMPFQMIQNHAGKLRSMTAAMLHAGRVHCGDD
jgi:hypothetical protein